MDRNVRVCIYCSEMCLHTRTEAEGHIYVDCDLVSVGGDPSRPDHFAQTRPKGWGRRHQVAQDSKDRTGSRQQIALPYKTPVATKRSGVDTEAEIAVHSLIALNYNDDE